MWGGWLPDMARFQSIEKGFIDRKYLFTRQWPQLHGTVFRARFELDLMSSAFIFRHLAWNCFRNTSLNSTKSLYKVFVFNDSQDWVVYLSIQVLSSWTLSSIDELLRTRSFSAKITADRISATYSSSVTSTQICWIFPLCRSLRNRFGPRIGNCNISEVDFGGANRSRV